MDPTLSTGDLEKLKKDLKHPTKDQYNTELLEKCILRTSKLEKKLSAVVDKDSILQKTYSDLQDMLKMITKYAIKSKITHVLIDKENSSFLTCFGESTTKKQGMLSTLTS